MQVYGYLFNGDKDVVKLVSRVMPLVASFQIADGLAGSSGGVLRGQGMPPAARVTRLTMLQVVNTLVQCAILLHTIYSPFPLESPWHSVGTSDFKVCG